MLYHHESSWHKCQPLPANCDVDQGPQLTKPIADSILVIAGAINNLAMYREQKMEWRVSSTNVYVTTICNGFDGVRMLLKINMIAHDKKLKKEEEKLVVKVHLIQKGGRTKRHHKWKVRENLVPYLKLICGVEFIARTLILRRICVVKFKLEHTRCRHHTCPSNFLAS